MAKIAVGLYDEIENARMAAEELLQAGFRSKDISLIANSSREAIRQYYQEPGETEETGEEAPEEAGAGVVGDLGELLVGLEALAIPGIGLALAAGPLVATLAGAGIGAAAGSLPDALVKAGIPSEAAELYAESVRRGGALLTLHTTDELADRAVQILNHYGPVDVEQRTQAWRQEGWQGFDERAEPYPAGQVEMDGGGVQRDADVPPSRPVDAGDMDAFQEGPFGMAGRSGGPMPVGQTHINDLDDYEDFFRRHYNATYGAASYSYDQYRPYYQYGWNLAFDNRFRDRPWEEVETEARRDWERTNPYRSWEDVRAAVHEGWNRATGSA